MNRSRDSDIYVKKWNGYTLSFFKFSHSSYYVTIIDPETNKKAFKDDA